MAVNRTIYTQGWVNLKISDAASSGVWPTSMTGAAGMTLTGVQSANFTVNSPKLDVNAFGVLGPINKVSVEPQAATLEVSMILNSGNSLQTGWISGLFKDACRPTPSGLTVTASGVGQIISGVCTSIRAELAVGALPTLSMTFEGLSGANVMSGAIAVTALNATTILVPTPADFGALYWSGTASGCPQSARFSWEMPVERLNCLGVSVDSPTVFTRPPGTVQVVTEGIDFTMLSPTGCFITGMKIAGYTFSAANMREVARSVNMAVGEASSTFNITAEGVGLAADISGP